ncbi:hypothetical protein ES703_35603 [subsurface metagenome]
MLHTINHVSIIISVHLLEVLTNKENGLFFLENRQLLLFRSRKRRISYMVTVAQKEVVRQEDALGHLKSNRNLISCSLT